MGFMDKAKEAAEDLKASFATTEVRDSEQAYRDLGMIAYLTTTGRPIDEADRQRLVNTLWALEQQAKLPPFRLVTSPPPPPSPAPIPVLPIRLEGEIGDVSGECPSIRFELRGRIVYTTNQTDFRKTDCRRIDRGTDLEVEGMVMSDGTVRADRVTRD